MSEVEEKPKRYQWVKGDNSGDVVSIKEVQTDADGARWTIFNEGGRISTEYFNEFLMPLDDNEPVIDVKITQQREVRSNIRTEVQLSVDPIAGILNKQSKTDKVELKLSVTMNLPKKDLYTVLSESFDSESVDRNVLDFCMNSINVDDVMKQLKNLALEYLKKKL